MMQIQKKGGTTIVRRGLGTDFEIGPIDDPQTSCDYHICCGRSAVYTIPHEQAGSVLERHCCREHLYRWAFLDDATLVDRVQRHVNGVDAPRHYWRPVQLTHDDVPNQYPVKGVRCVALGLDQMQRVHYLGPGLSTAAVGVIEDGAFRHEREPLDLGYHSVEDYIDVVADEGPGWYARKNTERVRETASQLQKNDDSSGEVA